ncbi:MAG: PAS domain-containing protein [Rhodospirillaceae bacterium]|nr:PAS domain-containing protein [Rhodospirillaceae bacterium]
MPDWRDTCHPDIRLVLDYWQQKCAGRAMPSRADIDPGDLRRFLPHITLVDVVDDPRRFVYRLVGTSEVELRGFDPTGKSVADAYFASSADAALLQYETTRVEKKPRYVADPFQMVDRFIGEEDLFLPLSNDGVTVNMILVFSIARDLYTPPAGEDLDA